MPNWTEEQNLAIQNRGASLLVSASAGTGKTAVLVERIIRLALDPEKPIDLDRFLIVTFTKAAAREMREKIAAAFREKLAENPKDPELRRQILLLENTQISTIHAFCSRAIRSHFHDLGIDPNFTTLDNEERQLLQVEVADAMLEEIFEKDEADNPILPQTLTNTFQEWMDSFSAYTPLAEARAQIQALHNFLQTLAQPRKWVEAVRNAWPLEPDGAGKQTPPEEQAWFNPWRERFIETLQAFHDRLAALAPRAKEIEPKILDTVTPMLDAARDALDATQQEDWEKAVSVLRECAPGHLGGVRKKDTPIVECKAEAEDLRKNILQGLIQKKLTVATPNKMCRDHAQAAPTVNLLLTLVELFEKRYRQSKENRAVLDFNDLEQLTLRLLRDTQHPAQPSAAAREYQDLFEYVMVDEYQDVNHAQEAIVSLVSRSQDLKRPNNLFLVGDVKQSIYGFRLAAPEIFMEKLASHHPATPVPSSGMQRREKVSLRHNFRSRAGVLAGVNFFFERLMTKDATEMEYDREAALVPGRDFPTPEKETGPAVECHLVCYDTDLPEQDDEEEMSPLAELSSVECDASLAADRIKALIGLGNEEPTLLADATAKGGFRRASFRDIVILVRSIKGHAEKYISILQDNGIPAFAAARGGFLAAQEVRDVLNLLRVIDNPRQDLALVALLRSPIIGWSEDDLMELRAENPKCPFHELLDTSRHPRVQAFRDMLEPWRDAARRRPLVEFLARLFEQTAYPTYVLGLRNGRVRRGNLEKLITLARKFDQFSRRGLARFLRLLEQFPEHEMDYGEASPLLEGEDVVRIMTIHESKGLEFPIVMVSGLGRQFNKQDQAKRVLCHRDGRMAIKVTDTELALTWPTPDYRQLREEVQRKNYAEELRLLYVAMTRAQEKLLLLGSVKKNREEWTDALQPALGPLAPEQILSAKGFMDWLGPIIVPLLKGQAPADTPFSATFHDNLANLGKTPLDRSDESTATKKEDEKQVEAALNRIQWTYPHAALAKAPARLAISEIKRRLAAMAETGETKPLLPRRQRGQSGKDRSEAAQRGIATHLVLQKIDLAGPLDYAGISGQVDAMIDRGLLTEEERGMLQIEALEKFFLSDLGRRLIQAPVEKVWREIPFLLALSPSEAGLTELAAYDDSESIRAQGVIDCLFEDREGRLVLLDYKTDSIPESLLGQRVESYLPQMEIYARAVEGVFGRRPDDTFLHFSYLGKTVSLPFQSSEKN